jgi:N-acetylmuramoyl-L-alanine amidase
MRRVHAISGLSAALLLACSGLVRAADVDIRGVTVVESGGRTRALIDVPDGTDYSVFTLSHPDRLVLDLHHSRFGSRFRAPGPDGVVSNVRTGQPVPGDARVVFELSKVVQPRSYFHDEDGRGQLVIDLLTAADRKGMDSPKPDPVIAVFTPAAAEGGVAANSSAIAAAPSTVSPSLPLTVSRPASPALAPADARQADARAAHVASAPAMGASADQHANADADPSAIAPDAAPVAIDHPGARTLRDVLGAGERKLVIAIDAGHGGKDTGARGYSGTLEKNVTLATARELARQVNAEPGMQAVLIRDGDYFVPLTDRYRKAREAKADLFVSIHADADPTHKATGSSVWVLSQRGVTSQAARWLADRENAADLIGGVSLSDRDDTLASVLLDLSQSATMKASDDAAERVHQALRDIGRTHKSHPEQANFVVLRSPDVPSMLVETAFITNAVEEQHLNDPGYRSRLAGAVMKGVRSYFIDNPLPGTEFAALHDRRGRGDAHAVAIAANAQRQRDPIQKAAARTNAAAPMQLASAADVLQVHVVQRGEKLRDIADRYGVSLLRLREVNDLQGNRVRSGQRLRIPTRSGAG